MITLKNQREGYAIAKDVETGIAYSYNVQEYSLIKPNQPEVMVPVYLVGEDGTIDFENEQKISNKKLKDQWVKLI